MKRFVTAVAALTLLPVAALAAEVNLRLGHVAPPGSNYDVAAHSLADKVKALSGGKMEIEIIGNGVLGAQPQLLAQVRSGTLDFYMIDTSGISMAKEARQFAVMLSPYLFRDQAHFRAFIASDTFKEMMAQTENDLAVKHVGVLIDMPARALSNDGRPVRSPADLKGMKIRVPEAPFFLAIWKEWGAVPTPVKATDLFQALQSGMVDGQENGISVVVELSLPEVQKYFSPIDYVVTGLSLYMSGQSWAKLSPEQQGWLSAAAAAVYQENLKTYPAYLESLYARAKSAGMTIVEPDLPAFRAAADGVAAQFDGKAWPAGLYAKIRDIR